MIDITEVRIFPVSQPQNPKLLAFVTVVVNDCFVIKDLKVIQGANGLFLSMPAKKTKDGAFSDIVHPLNQATRDLFQEKVFDAYYKATTEST